MILHRHKMAIIRTFHQYCLNLYKDDIDLVPYEIRQRRLGLERTEGIPEYLSLTLKNTPLFNLALLIESPRQLKLILRHTKHAWSVLHGEIDFDDLLIAKALRFCAPEAYDFLLEDIAEIRNIDHDFIKEPREKRGQLQEKWKQKTKSVEWDTIAAEALITFLLPEWNERSIFERFDIPQGISKSEPVDYWIRANLEAVPDGEIRDQVLLNKMKTWKETPEADRARDTSLVDDIYQNTMLAHQFESLARYFLNGQDIRNLAAHLFECIINHDGVKANRSSAEGFSSLWRLSLNLRIDDKEHHIWVLNQIFKYLQVSLRFANDLYYFWKHTDRRTIDIKQPMPEVREPMIIKAKEIFGASPDTLIKIIDPEFIYSSYHFAVFYSSEKEGGSGFKPEDWYWFGNALYAAAKLKPEIILPQMSCILIGEDYTAADFGIIYKYNEEPSKMFQNNMGDLMQLLTRSYNFSFLDEKGKKRMEYTQQYARKWLEDSIAGPE